MLGCRTCRAHEAHIASLEAALAEERVERRQLLDRVMALANPAALAQVSVPTEPCRTFAQDEHGTVVLEGGVERPVAGEDDLIIDGERVAPHEAAKWFSRLSEEASAHEGHF